MTVSKTHSRSSQPLLGPLGRLALHVVAVGMALVWMLPSVGLLVSSFRSAGDVARSGWWTSFDTPWSYTLDNYQRVLTTHHLADSFFNSLLVSLPATVLPLLVAAYAAYAFAWLEFPGRRALFVMVVALLIVPLQMTLIPVLRVYNQIGLTGTFVGIWLAHAAYGLPFAVFLLHNAFASLPREMLEATQVDGASPVMVFFRVVLPTSIPAFASLAIFQFLWVWNDLLVALIFLGGKPSVAPLTVSLANLVNSLGQNWHLLTAASFIAMAVPLALFFALQRYFVRGLLAGSVKG